MRILIVEDSHRLAMSLSRGLSKEGYAVDVALDGEQAEAALQVGDYEIVILDVMLPKVDGLTILEGIRRRGDDSLVLILSAKDQVEHRVRGLDMGADDYLVKPFDFSELCSRLQALVRRRNSISSPRLRLGSSLVMDTVARRVLKDGSEVPLTATEYRLVEFLALRAGKIFSKEKLIESLYPANTYVTSNTIEVMMSGVRRKLEEGELIRTRRGLGYCVETESVRPIGGDETVRDSPVPHVTDH